MKRRPSAAATSNRSSGERLTWLALLLLVAFVVKAAVLAELGSHPLLQPHGNLDTTSYIDLARRVAEAGPLAIPEPFFVSPLYVYFLALIFSLGGSLMAARVVQILLGTAAAGLVYLTARQWFGPWAARIATAFYIFTGLFTFYEILILQAALDPFLVACALYFTSRTQVDDGRWWPVLMAGVSLGLLALNRPNALAYGLVAAILIVLHAWRRPSAARRPAGQAALVRGAVFVAGLALVLAPNALRNYLASGELVVISSHGGLNFYIGNNADADGTYTRIPGITASIVGQAQDATRLAEAAAGRRLSTGEVSAYFYARAWAWIAANPAAAARLLLRKLAITVNHANVPLNFSYAYYARDESMWLRVLVVGPALLVPLGLVGLFLPSMRTGRRGFWVWASFVPVYGVSVAAFFVSSRYRMPLLVPLCASAGATAAWTVEQIRGRHFVRVILPAVAAGLLAIATLWNLGLDEGRGGEQTRQAVWLVEQARYDDARRYVDAVAATHSHPGVLRFQFARALAAAGRFDEAIPQFQRALDIDRGQPAIHLDLGQALLVSKRADEAVAHLSAAYDAAFRPQVSGPWLARALALAGRRERATTLLAGMPDEIAAPRAETAIELGTLALTLDAPSAAERWLRIAAAREPGRAEAHEKLGVALIMLRRPDEAVAPLETACQLDPSAASAHLNLAVAYAQLGRAVDARAHAERAVQLDPREPRAEALLKALQRR